MFSSLLLGRGEESDSPTLRRLLYGYNAVLTGLLLLGILAAINVLAYLYLPVSSDWTEAGIYTLADKSQSLLKNLKQPVTIYVMEVQRGDRFDIGMRDLMGNVRALTDKVQAEYVIRDINRDEMNRLKELYKPEGEQGVIVVYGTGDNAPHTFIPMSRHPAAAADRPADGQADARRTAVAVPGRGPHHVGHRHSGGGQRSRSSTSPRATASWTCSAACRGCRPTGAGKRWWTPCNSRDNYEVKGLLLGEEGAAGLDPQIVGRQGRAGRRRRRHRRRPDEAAVAGRPSTPSRSTCASRTRRRTPPTRTRTGCARAS